MTETINEFQRRIADYRTPLYGWSTHRSLGATALGQDGISHQEMELLDNLPKPKRPKFLEQFAAACETNGLPLGSVRNSDRPLLAHYAYEFILESVYEQNDKRLEKGEKPLKLSPMHLMVGRKLNLYYAAFSDSLRDTKPEAKRLQALRLDRLEYDTDTARTYLPLGYVDLNLAEGFQRMMTDFYPGAPAEAATELLAAYGADRERVSIPLQVLPPLRHEPSELVSDEYNA